MLRLCVLILCSALAASMVNWNSTACSRPVVTAEVA